MSQIGVAVVGAGFIGPVHVEALRRAGQKVVGILGVDENESRSAAEKLSIPKAYLSFDEVLADAEAQAVHLCTPNKLHYPMAKAALEAGKHVLCEKPLAMNSTESAELVAMAKGRRQAAAVNYNIRYYPLALEAKDRVRAGQIGEVFHVCGSYTQDWLFYPTDYNWRVLAEEGGALRAIADIGTHWLDLMANITGLEVEAVCADLKTVWPVRQRPKGEVETFSGKTGPKQVELEPIDIQTEDYGCVMLKFKNGARGTLYVSQVYAGRKNCLRLEIAGSKAALSWNSEAPNQLWIGHREKANELLIRDPSLLGDYARQFANYPGGHNEGFPDTMKQCFRAFYGYIQAGDFDAPPTFPTFEDGHKEILLCEAILRSHQEQRWVTL
ncbi:MAG: Gfo/Idh/MocA family oxidoreductase [Fimbriimonadales bacterium]|nr:Gfo/Idh/MocA family oxidoreductase [Fimbriimonadales bacterium]